MTENILLVFDNYDPVSNYKLSLVQEALKIADFNTILFLFHAFNEGDRIFSPEEKIALLSSSIPNTLSPKYIIDGDSFSKENRSVLKEIERIKGKYRDSTIYLLLDSHEFEYIQEIGDLAPILNITRLMLYIHPEHKYLLEQANIALNKPLIINTTEELTRLSKASIFNPKEGFYSDLVFEYINKSSEVAIKRIKSHQSESRFKHSLRVAGTVKQICDVLEIKDSEVRYDSYLAALYHDICKEIPPEEQIKLAEEKLGMGEYPSYRVLHGPLGANYMKTQYGITNEGILEAVTQHTHPNIENPKLITKLVYLADHLEINKKSYYKEEGLYERLWDLLGEKKIDEVFYFIIDYLKHRIMAK